MSPSPAMLALPLGDHLIDAAAVGYLVVDLPAAGVPVLIPVAAGRGASGTAVDHGGIGFDQPPEHALVAQINELVVVLAVETDCASHPTVFPLRKQGTVLGCGLRILQVLGHLRGRLQGCQVESGEPGVRAEQLGVEGVVLPALQHAVPCRGPPAVRGCPATRRTRGLFLDGRPEPGQPIGVSRYLPVPIHLGRCRRIDRRRRAGTMIARARGGAECGSSCRRLRAGCAGSPLRACLFPAGGNRNGRAYA